MKVSIAVSLLLIALTAVSCQRQLISIIDDFTLAPEDGQFVGAFGQDAEDSSVFTTLSDNPVGLVGGERDIYIQNRGTGFFSASVDTAQNFFSASTPVGGAGFASVEIDGKDGVANSVDTQGLDINLRESNGDSFNFTVIADLDVTYVFNVFDRSGRVSTVNQFVQALDTIREQVLFVQFSAFSGSADFTDVGAISIEITTTDSVDATISLLGVSGLPPPSPSRTAAPTPPPTPSNTPIPIPSQTRTPTPTNTPSRSPQCLCRCPVFTCALIFDPDDDENDAYYFNSSDFGTNFTPFPDNDRSNSNTNSNTNSNNNNSSASAVTIGVATILAVVAALVF